MGLKTKRKEKLWFSFGLIYSNGNEKVVSTSYSNLSCVSINFILNVSYQIQIYNCLTSDGLLTASFSLLNGIFCSFIFCVLSFFTMGFPICDFAAKKILEHLREMAL